MRSMWFAIALCSSAAPARAGDVEVSQDAYASDDIRLDITKLAEPPPRMQVDRPTDPGDPDGAIADLVAGAVERHEEPPLVGKGEFEVHVAPDGAARVVDGPNVRLGARRGPPVDADPAGAVVMSFDVTDAFMRRHGMDPYASAKLRALDASRDTRVAAGLAYRARRLDATAQLVAANIARALALPSPALQRAALRDLAAECATTGSVEIVAAGRLARVLIDAALSRQASAAP